MPLQLAFDLLKNNVICGRGTITIQVLQPPTEPTYYFLSNPNVVLNVNLVLPANNNQAAQPLVFNNAPGTTMMGGVKVVYNMHARLLNIYSPSGNGGANTEKPAEIAIPIANGTLTLHLWFDAGKNNGHWTLVRNGEPLSAGVLR